MVELAARWVEGLELALWLGRLEVEAELVEYWIVGAGAGGGHGEQEGGRGGCREGAGKRWRERGSAPGREGTAQSAPPGSPTPADKITKTRSSLEKSHLSWTPLHTGQLPRSLSNRSRSRVELVKVLNDISPQGHQLQLCQGKFSPQGDIWLLLVHFLGQLNKELAILLPVV